MNKHIYIASGLGNYQRVLRLRDKLSEYGIWLTYDWADAFRTHLEEQAATGKVIEENLEAIAKTELQAVKDCHLLILIAPGGRGSHFELGVAFVLDKPIVILYDNPKDKVAFHTLPGIERFLDEELLIKKVLEIVG
jgi:nucleoside 2-deoxyribosyltransferase